MDGITEVGKQAMPLDSYLLPEQGKHMTVLLKNQIAVVKDSELSIVESIEPSYTLEVSATCNNTNEFFQTEANATVQNFSGEVNAENNKIAFQELSAKKELIEHGALQEGDFKASN